MKIYKLKDFYFYGRWYDFEILPICWKTPLGTINKTGFAFCWLCFKWEFEEYK